MENFLKQNKKPIYLIFIFTIIGIATRFYNLNWGAPYFFHPDERNVASSITQLQFPRQMNPNFFAYGSLPIYTIYFTGLVINNFAIIFSKNLPNQNNLQFQITFEQAILIMRFYSAFFSTLLIPLLYFIGKRIHSVKAGVITSFFALTSVGFLQFAHFGTFEMWSTFFSVILLLVLVSNTKKTAQKLFLSGLLLGILFSIKISNLVLLALPLLYIIFLYKKLLLKKISLFVKITSFIQYFLYIFFLILLPSIVIFFATNPYTILDNEHFLSGISYETNVATGKLPVFYTQEYVNTIPVIFQILKVYPFLINPLLTILFFPSFFYFIWLIFKYKNNGYSFILFMFLCIFLSQAFLFVKWIRYMVPTLPFMYLMLSICIAEIFFEMKKNTIKHSVNFILILIMFVTFSFATAYTFTIMLNPDTRITARNWMQKHLPHNAKVISEVYDPGSTAFNNLLIQTTYCDFYNYEENPYLCSGESLETTLNENDYILIPSERIMQSRLLNPLKYPKGFAFYLSLLQGNATFRKIYESPCNFLCKILYGGSPLYSFEQTANVFDRPTIYIFEKNKSGI